MPFWLPAHTSGLEFLMDRFVCTIFGLAVVLCGLLLLAGCATTPSMLMADPIKAKPDIPHTPPQTSEQPAPPTVPTPAARPTRSERAFYVYATPNGEQPCSPPVQPAYQRVSQYRMHNRSDRRRIAKINRQVKRDKYLQNRFLIHV